MGTRILALATAVLILSGGCRNRRVVMDHDGSIDDYVALLMLLSSPDCDLRGVTISFGNCYRDAAVEATVRILATYGRPAPVGAYPPSRRGKNEFPAAWRAQGAAVAELPAFSAQPAGVHSVEDSISVLRQVLAPAGLQRVDVLATGPMTNIAAVLGESPGLASHIGRLVVMGGAVRVAGNAPGGLAEYNFFVDPEAADAVLSMAERGLHIELIPLDATNHLPVTPQFVERLLARPEGPAQQGGQLLGLAGEAISTGSRYYLWDGGAALALLRPELFSFATMRIKVTPEGRTMESPDGHGPVRVAVGMRPGARPMEEVMEVFRRKRR